MQHYPKVKRAVIDPMMSFYGGTPLPDPVVEAFVEDIGGYSGAALTAAWKKVRQECRTRPNLAHFVAVLRESAKPEIGGGIRQNPDRYREHKNNALADEMMRSSVGQLALSLGVGQSVWMTAWRDGKRCDEADVYRFRDAWREATDKVVKAKPGEHGVTVTRFYETITAKERELFAKYGPKRMGGASV